jgi:hypothetical protein
MFHDPTIVGSWPTLAARLDDDAVLARWAEAESDLAEFTTVAELLAVWSDWVCPYYRLRAEHHSFTRICR